MREEISSGGVVISEKGILLLKKFNSNWVLPKGRIEEGETREQAAIREVQEETGIKSNILRYIGEIHYTFYNPVEQEQIHKTVYWYLMEAENIITTPQIEEGFVRASFLPSDLALSAVKFEDERTIIRQAVNSEEIKKYNI